MPDDKKDTKCRVCLFSTVQRPNDVRMWYRECKSLVREGFDVHMIVPWGISGMKEGACLHDIKLYKNRILRMLLLPLVVVFKALRTRASIYHFHDPELLIVGFLMRWIFWRKVVFDMRESTARQIMGKEYLPKWSRVFISLCYRAVEFACTKGLAIIVANDWSAKEHPGSYLVRNFPEIDEQLMAGAAEMPERLRKPLLIYVGGVWESRGALIYVDLAQRLKMRGHRINLLIIGPYEGDFGRRLRAKIRELELQDTVELRGLMDYREAMSLVSRATIGLSILQPIPNYTFCLSGKIIEYMMCGTPVLTSRFAPWQQYVEGERTGRMVDPGDMDEIVDVCEQMLTDQDALAEMGKRGMDAVRSKYNWSLESKELLRCYHDVLGR